MEKPKFRKRVDPILRDIRPIQRTPAPQERQGQLSQPRKLRKIRFPRRLIKPLFVLGIAALILVVSIFSAQSLFKGESGNVSFGHLRELIGTLLNANSDIGKLKDDGFNLAFNGRGEELIVILKSLQANIAKLEALGVGFIDESTLLAASDGLDALITFLDKPGEQRLLVLFLNPSEIRPIGGFAGSYGEIVLERGSVKEIKVNDIYYPDRFLARKIVPPKELQSVTVDWGARDAAWFFNFPTSARKTMELLEASDIYAKDGASFDGVVAINVRAVEDVLALTGPIELKEYNLTLTKDNFLEEIQREVEEGRDKKLGENPKRVLSALTPILIERLNELDSSDKNALALTFFGRAVNKDIQLYFNDSKMEDFVKRVGWAGEMAAIDENMSGDYLAVVNANVAGGKTDAKIAQKIQLKSEIDGGGRVNNHLTVTRHHLGKTSDASWYRVKNQNFIKIFTVPKAELVSLMGDTPKNVRPQINYGAAGYLIDPELKAVQSTHLESGKKVFGTWFSTLLGEEKFLEVNYKGGEVFLAPKVKYRFIFDKQSGVESVFQYELIAPSGYKWQETNGSTFTYKSDTIPARLVIELTLARI